MLGGLLSDAWRPVGFIRHGTRVSRRARPIERDDQVRLRARYAAVLGHRCGIQPPFGHFDGLAVLTGRLRRPAQAVDRSFDGVQPLTQHSGLGRLRIERRAGEDLGDIDVLVADPAERRLCAVEAKDLAVARTPAELKSSSMKVSTFTPYFLFRSSISSATSPPLRVRCELKSRGLRGSTNHHS